MREVHACRLPLAGEPRLGFERALALVRSEVTGQVHAAPDALEGQEGTLAPSPGVALRWRLLTAPGVDDRLWTLRWQRPHEHDADLAWELGVDVALDGPRAWVDVRLALRPVGYRVLPVRFDPEPPSLVGTLLDTLEVVEDGWHLTREPAYAVDHAGVAELADLLLDPERVLPVVVISGVEVYDEERDEYRVEPVVDAHAVARALAGLAHVAVLDTRAATFALTHLVGRELSVFGGAVRLFWPGLGRHDRREVHPLWVRDRLKEPRNQPFPAVLLRRVATAATFRLTTASLEARLQAAADRHRRAETARLWERAKDASLAPEWQQELERTWSEVELLREQNADLAKQLAVAHENLQAMAAAVVPRDDDETDVDAAGELDAGAAPATVAEAVEWAAARADHLVFLDDALASARRAAYRQVGRLWLALTAMDEVAGAWQRGELGAGFLPAFAERGFDFSPAVSSTVIGRYPHEYERTYEGERIVLGPHLRLGRGSPEACCRIYFYVDQAKKAFVIGHVGNHLSDNTSG